jgi:hypothetical protein
MLGHMHVFYVNKIEYKGKEKNRAHTELHTFHRLSFTHFQGLCSMELDEEEQEEKKKRERQSNLTTQ